MSAVSTCRPAPRVLALCVLLASLVAEVLPATAQATRHGDVERGKRLYYRHGCYGCHGFNGETGERRLVGSPLLGDPHTFIAFLRMRADLTPLLPSTGMPRFPVSTLSDGDALDLYAYVRSFVLHAPDPQGIAAFQQILESAQRRYTPPR